MDRKKTSATAFYIFCLSAGLLKLWLISGEEIIARYQPLDDLWQIVAASRGYWFGKGYDWTTYVRLPVYPIWIAGVYFTGVPLRVGTELLFILTSFLFTLSLIRANIPKLIAAIIYISIIFHPASFSLFNYALAETLYAPALLLALASMIFMVENRQSPHLKRYSILTGASLALLWHIRPEGELVSIFLLSFALGLSYLLWHERRTPREIARILSVMILIPCIMIFSASICLKTANLLKMGLFVSTEMSAPGYLAAYKALLRIKPEKSIRFIPVTKEVRALAYSISPAFRELQPFLEGENFGTKETAQATGLKGEIAAGWFYWRLRQAVAQAGHGNSAIEMNAFFQRVADEINAAIDTGKLPSRVVWSQFLDPDTGNYLPYLANSLVKVGSLFTSTTEPPKETDDAANISIRRDFDIVANRRASLTTNEPIALSGWIFSESSGVKKLSIQDSNGNIVGSTDQFLSRPDVARGFQSSGLDDVPEKTGFSLSTTVTTEKISDYSLLVETRDNVLVRIPFKDMSLGKVAKVLDSGSNITYAIDTMTQRRAAHTSQTLIKNFLWLNYGKILVLLGYIGVAAFLSLLFCYRFARHINISIFLILWLLFSALFSRLLLFAVLDASSWPGNQVRYLFPVMQFYCGFLILLIYSATQILRARLTKKS